MFATTLYLFLILVVAGCFVFLRWDLTRTERERRRGMSDREIVVALGYERGARFRYALERGWITRAEHDEARARYGNRWNYTGD